MIHLLTYLFTINMAQIMFIVICLISLFFPNQISCGDKRNFFFLRIIRFISDFCIVFTALTNDSILVKTMRIIKFASDLRIMTEDILLTSRRESHNIKSVE